MRVHSFMRLPLSPARRSGKKADKGQYAPFVQIGGHPSGGFRARDLMSRHRSLRVLQLQERRVREVRRTLVSTAPTMPRQQPGASLVGACARACILYNSVIFYGLARSSHSCTRAAPWCGAHTRRPRRAGPRAGRGARRGSRRVMSLAPKPLCWRRLFALGAFML